MFGRVKDEAEAFNLAEVKVHGNRHISKEGDFVFINKRLEFDIYTPWFAEACRERIKELQELFNGAEWSVKKINYHYPI